MASDLQTSNSISFKEHDSPTDQEGCPSISYWDDSQEPDINSVESQPNSCESETDHERPGNEPNGQGADPGKCGDEPPIRTTSRYSLRPQPSHPQRSQNVLKSN